MQLSVVCAVFVIAVIPGVCHAGDVLDLRAFRRTKPASPKVESSEDTCFHEVLQAVSSAMLGIRQPGPLELPALRKRLDALVGKPVVYGNGPFFNGTGTVVRVVDTPDGKFQVQIQSDDAQGLVAVPSELLDRIHPLILHLATQTNEYSQRYHVRLAVRAEDGSQSLVGGTLAGSDAPRNVHSAAARASIGKIKILTPHDGIVEVPIDRVPLDSISITTTLSKEEKLQYASVKRLTDSGALTKGQMMTFLFSGPNARGSLKVIRCKYIGIENDVSHQPGLIVEYGGARHRFDFSLLSGAQVSPGGELTHYPASYGSLAPMRVEGPSIEPEQKFTIRKKGSSTEISGSFGWITTSPEGVAEFHYDTWPKDHHKTIPLDELDLDTWTFGPKPKPYDPHSD